MTDLLENDFPNSVLPGIDPNATKPRVHGLLLHNRKLQNTELQLLYERQALPRPRLCSFVSTLLLEGNAGIGFSHRLQCENFILFIIDIFYTIFFLTKHNKALHFAFSVCKALVWWRADKPPRQSRKVCLSNVGCRVQSGIWKRQDQRSWMVMSSGDYVKWSNCVPIVLGLCKGLGFASSEFQKSMA